MRHDTYWTGIESSYGYSLEAFSDFMPLTSSLSAKAVMLMWWPWFEVSDPIGRVLPLCESAGWQLAWAHLRYAAVSTSKSICLLSCSCVSDHSATLLGCFMFDIIRFSVYSVEVCQHFHRKLLKNSKRWFTEKVKLLLWKRIIFWTGWIKGLKLVKKHSFNSSQNKRNLLHRISSWEKKTMLRRKRVKLPRNYKFHLYNKDQACFQWSSD